MTATTWSFRELCAFDEMGHLDEHLHHLLRPHALRVEEPEADLAPRLQRLQKSLGADRAHLPGQALAAAFLLNAGNGLPDRVAAAVAALMDPAELGLDLDWRHLNRLQWSAAAIALADPSGATIFWALVGAAVGLPPPAPWPRWWPDVADAAAVEAVSAAFHLLADDLDAGCYFWPILPSLNRPAVTGRSLALPVYLAGWSACRGLTPDPGAILATGGLDRSGRLLPVGYLDAKLRAAEKSGFSAFFYPAKTAAAAAAESTVDRVALQDRKGARDLFRLYSETDGRNLPHYFHCVQRPDRLAANLHLFPEPLFGSATWWDLYRRQVAEVLKSASLARQLAANVEHWLDRPDCSGRHMTRLLQPLTRETLLALGQEAPVTAFGLAQAQLLAANHQGDIDRSDAWKRTSEELWARVKQTEGGWQRYLDHLNRALVNDRHNHYDFRPELPGTVAEHLARVERSVEALRAYHPSAGINRALGRFYGTIAQNYGFCGPAHLDRVVHYVELAKQAFGGDHNRELEAERRRQLNYLVYAYLDAGETDRAEAVLRHYLGTSIEALGEQQPDRLDPYQHAAVARFLSDTGRATAGYPEWIRRHLNDRPGQHPWQLWLVNAGRLLSRPEDRKTAWQRSFRLCRTAAPTMRIMALLPLAALDRAGWITHAEAAAETRKLLDWLPHSGLKADHFRPLLDAGSPRAALRLVQQQPQTWFPFTYR